MIEKSVFVKYNMARKVLMLKRPQTWFNFPLGFNGHYIYVHKKYWMFAWRHYDGLFIDFFDKIITFKFYSFSDDVWIISSKIMSTKNFLVKGKTFKLKIAWWKNCNSIATFLQCGKNVIIRWKRWVENIFENIYMKKYE